MIENLDSFHSPSRGHSLLNLCQVQCLVTNYTEFLQLLWLSNVQECSNLTNSEQPMDSGLHKHFSMCANRTLSGSPYSLHPRAILLGTDELQPANGQNILLDYNLNCSLWIFSTSTLYWPAKENHWIRCVPHKVRYKHCPVQLLNYVYNNYVCTSILCMHVTLKLLTYFK